MLVRKLSCMSQDRTGMLAMRSGGQPDQVRTVSRSRDPSRRCFANECEEIGVCPDVVRDGVIWCALHAQQRSFCSVCGRTPICRIGVLSIDRDPDGGVRAPLHSTCRNRLDMLVKDDAVLQNALAGIRTKCVKLSHFKFCETDCDACQEYITTKDVARDKIQRECLRASIDGLHREYERDGDQDYNCERCDRPRNVQWSQNAAYLCRNCEQELDEPLSQNRQCLQCGSLHDISEFVTLEFAGDESSALCPRCFQQFAAADAEERCILCTSVTTFWSTELEAYVCSTCWNEKGDAGTSTDSGEAVARMQKGKGKGSDHPRASSPFERMSNEEFAARYGTSDDEEEFFREMKDSGATLR